MDRIIWKREIIELKENKYRVTIKDITFEVNSGVNSGGVITTSKKSYSFGDYIVKDKKIEFRKSKRIQEVLKSIYRTILKTRKP